MPFSSPICLCSTHPSPLQSDLRSLQVISRNTHSVLAVNNLHANHPLKKCPCWSPGEGTSLGQDDTVTLTCPTIPRHSWSLQRSNYWPGCGKSSSLILGSRAKKLTPKKEVRAVDGTWKLCKDAGAVNGNISYHRQALCCCR